MADPDIAAWVVEFILRRRDVEDYIANELFFSLRVASPLPARLEKTLLIRSLASNLSRRSISLHSLHSLEILDDLHYRAAAPSSCSESMNAAYCAVARHCLAQAIRASDDEVSVRAFIESLNCRVGDLQQADPAVLVGPPLGELRKDLAAVEESGSNARTALIARDTAKEALDAVRVYLEEAEEEMGPSFLELAAQVVTRNGIELKEGPSGGVLVEYHKKDTSSEDAGVVPPPGASCWSDAPMEEGADGQMDCPEMTRELSPQSLDGDMDCPDMNKEIPSPSREIVDKHIDAETATEHGMSFHAGTSTRKIDPLPTPEVEKVVNALKSSCMDLQMVVNDPLPDAVRRAAAVMGVRIEEATKLDAPKIKMHVERTEHRVGDVVVHDANEGAGTSGTNTNSGVLKQSLMDWNPTAHTYEWDDSVESLSEKSPSSSKNLGLPSPKRTAVSPLKIQENKTFTKRRKIKKWSLLEEETLRNAVEKHGKGNWKTILNIYTDIFEERTEVDLKDKWRNMTRH